MPRKCPDRFGQRPLGTVKREVQGVWPISALLRRTRTTTFYVLTFLIVTAAAIWLGLRVTPLQTVSAAGQTAEVGATLPNASIKGPGELDLFGQVMPTRPEFTGPIRPRLELNHISISPQVVQMLRSDGSHKVELTFSQQLADGWERYFLWETLIAIGFAAVPLIAIAAVRKKPKIWKLVTAGVAVVCVVNVGGILLTASGTPKALRSVKTLDDLAGVDPLTEPPAVGKPDPGVQAVVIGDSTASGWGLPWGPDPTDLDKACGRSADAYSRDLATANNWNVLSVACGSATIENGLLGPQVLYNGQVAPPQLPEAEAATHAKVVIVSVGADDLQWGVMTQLCAATQVCNDKISGAYFGQLLDKFTRSYYELLSDLVRLPGHPAVLINEYYDPFGSSLSCLRQYGMTPAKEKVLVSRLGQLNTVLAQGASSFGFGIAAPQFKGHELCTQDPYVQGPGDPAPLHPNAAGELAIALADEQALPALTPAPVVLPSPSPSPSVTQPSVVG
ncbi:MAG TPA: GDSL-type esterase/lipase family protein [Trebonia sp.]|nr:GDSL-type esterase/lipase family protein [Trebonia sp.]